MKTKAKKRRNILSKMLILILIILSFLILLIIYAGSGIVDKSDLKKLENGKAFQFKEDKNIEFTLMTFNCGYFSGMKNNGTEKLSKDLIDSNFKNFTNYIKDNPVDIICLQEIDFNSKRTFYVDQALMLYKKAVYNSYSNVINWNKRYVPFPYWPISAHFGKIVSGQSVLSKFRIVDHLRIVLEKPNKNSEEFKMISEDRVRDFEKIISNISNEKKKIVMGALKNNMKVDLSNTDSGAPEILIIQQKIRDLQNSGEMSTDHPDLSENLPEMISDLDNRKKVDGKIDKEKIQDITLDTATTDQIINWANFIKKEKK